VEHAYIAHDQQVAVVCLALYHVACEPNDVPIATSCRNEVFFLHISLQFQQMLMHRAQKRMQNSLSLHEISPHLAAISSSCITMPGHNQDDEVRSQND